MCFRYCILGIVVLLLCMFSASAAEWEATIIVTNIDVPEVPVQLLTFGADSGASDGFDPAHDVVLPPPGQSPVALDAAFIITGLFPRLSKDIKLTAGINQWQLSVRSDTGQLRLAWDVSGVPLAKSVFLLNGETVDMRAQNSLELAQGQHSLTLEVQASHLDLAISKAVDNPTPNVGDIVTYIVTVNNNEVGAATGIKVTDQLPPGVTHVSSTRSQGGYSSSTGVWDVGWLASGSSATLTITATVDSGTSGDTITNTASLTDLDQEDSDNANNSDSADITVQVVDLAVNKTVNNPTPNEGNTITYTVTASNNGPNTATGVEITDQLPPGITYTSSTRSQGSYNNSTGAWDVGSLANSASATLTITATVDPGTSGNTITNTASLTDVDQEDSNSGNDSASASIIAHDVVVQTGDLVVSKTANSLTPNEGDTIVYTVTVTNDGPDAVTGIEITDKLPSGVIYASSTVIQGSYINSTGVWNVGNLANGAGATLTITATVGPGTGGDTITNAAHITAADQADSDSSNNSANVSIVVQNVTVQTGDLAVSKTVGNPAPNVGDTITYTVTVTNDGPDTVTGIEITDQLPSGVTYKSSNPGQGSYNSNTGVWNAGGLTNGANVTLSITATVDSGNGGGTITNTANIMAADQSDPNTSNNSASASITIQGAAAQSADLSLSMAVSDTMPNEGDTIIYTVAVTNNGPDAATSINITDQLPSGITYKSSNADQGSYNNGTGVWNVGSLFKGSSAALIITAIASWMDGEDTIANTASIKAVDQSDPDNSNNATSVSIVKNPTIQIADLELNMKVTNSAPNPGDTITYTIRVDSSGPDATTNIKIIDQLPSGVTYVSSTPRRGSYDATTGVWYVGNLKEHGSATLYIVVVVNALEDSPIITNTARVEHLDQIDPRDDNNEDSVEIVLPLADIDVNMSVDDMTPGEGDTVIYTITVTNNGPDNVARLKLAALLPAGITYAYADTGRNDGGYNSATGIWYINGLMTYNGAKATLTIGATVDVGTAGNVITNTARILDMDQADPDISNNTSSIDILVGTDLAASMSVDDVAPNEGDSVIYTILVTNNGPNDATGIQVADQLPPGVTYVSDTPGQGSYNNDGGVWDIGDLNNGDSTMLTIVAAVILGTSGSTIVNTATLTAVDQGDLDPKNDSDSANITVQSADLAVSAEVSNTTPQAGSMVTYTIRVTNNGPNTATNIQVVGLLPANVTSITDQIYPDSSSSRHNIYSSSHNIWILGELANDDNSTLVIDAQVDADAPVDTLSNTVSIIAVDQADPDKNNNSDSVEITVQGVEPANAPPAAYYLAISPPLSLTDDDLVCSYSYSDADGDPESGSEIKWYMDGVMQTAYNDVLTIPSNATSSRQGWYFTVRPSDGKSFGELGQSDTVTIGNTPPVASNLDISPLLPKTADDLICSYDYSDPDGDLESSSEVRWYMNGVMQTAYNDTQTIPSSVTSSGQEWYCTVSPSDGKRFGESKQSDVAIIGNTPPVADNLDISPSLLLTGDDLLCSYDYSDLDGDPESGSEIRWYMDGVMKTAYNNTLTIPFSVTLSGQEWYFIVSPSDGNSFGGSKQSETVTIGNTPPTVSNLAITPAFPMIGDNLVCSYDHSDADGDPESGSEIKWYMDGVMQTIYNDILVIPSSVTSTRQKWHYTVRPSDGENFGRLKQSDIVTIGNVVPVASNLTLTPVSPRTGDDLVCSYDYSDIDGDHESGSEIRWYMDGVLQTVYNDTLIIPSSAASAGQEWRFTVRPSDGKSFGDLKQSDTITIGNTPSVASNIDISPSLSLTGDDLVCSYDYSDLDGDPESGSEIRWYMDNVIQTAYNDVLIIPSSATSSGQEWHCTVRPSDGKNFGELKQSDTTTIGNTLPVASNTAVTPATPMTGDNLLCNYDYSDADGDSESGSEIKWYMDGVLQTAYNDALTIPSSATSAGQKWRFTVRPSDGGNFGELKQSGVVIIGNTPPVSSNLNISLSLTADDLSCNYDYSDADGDPESNSEIRWYMDNVIQTAYNDVLIIPSSATSSGQKWRFTVSPSDGENFGGLRQSDVVIIGNTPPVTSTLDISPPQSLTGDDLICGYDYSDIDGDPESGSEIRWYMDGVLQTVYNDTLVIPSSATSSGQEWYVTVKPSDGNGFGELKQSDVMIIGNTPPVTSTLDISPLQSLTGDDLICGYDYSDIDGDPESGSEIRWYVDGVIQTANSDTLTIPSNVTSAGQEWYFTVRPSDGKSFGELKRSDIVIISNTPPLVDDLSLSPASPMPDGDLLCNYDYSDADGDAESGSEIRWYMDGVLQTRYNDVLIIPSSVTSSGQEWYVTVRPNDGKSFGELQQSDIVTIGNTSPVADNLDISPVSPMPGDDLVCSYGYSDADGDAESGSEIRWYMDGVLQTGYNDVLIIPSSATLSGQEWYFIIRPSDGKNSGELQQSDTVTIGNTPPVADNLDISPLSPKTANDLICSYDYSDPDGDLESGSEIRWYIDGALQIAHNDILIIPSSSISSGQEWYCTVKASDGKSFGELKQSDSVIIGNTPPMASNLAVAPASPGIGDNLVCSYDYSDADGDPESDSEIRWYMDGVIQTAYNDVLTIPSSATSSGQEWYSTVRPSDGQSFGKPRQSDVAIIGNTPPVADNLAISPSLLLTGDDLLCSYDYSDLDGDSESGSEIRWYMDGVIQTAYNDVLTTPSSATSSGQEWRFTISPSDGKNSGELQQSDTVTIDNTPPAAEGLDIFPSLPKTGDDLVFSYDYSDIDGDPEEGSEIRWYMDGVLQTAYNDILIIPSSDTSSGQEWYCTINPNDGRDHGALEISPTVVIWNSRPLLEINGPYKGVVGMAVQFTSAGSSDIDDDMLMYVWDFDHRNGKDDIDSTDPNPTHIYMEPGIYIVTLTVNDGALGSSIDTSQVDIKTEINGSVAIQGYDNSPAFVTMSLRASGTDKVLETFNTVTDNGNFTILTSLGSGVYDILVSKENYLKGIARNVSIPDDTENIVFDSEILGIPTGELRGGDCNGDNAVTLADLSLLAYHYNEANTVGDINGDGLVNLMDFSILKSNFGIVGIDGYIPDQSEVLFATGDGSNKHLRFHVFSNEDMSMVHPGDEFDVHVKMENADHLKGYSVGLRYDHNALQVIELDDGLVREGGFLESNLDGGSTLFISRVYTENGLAGKLELASYITGNGLGVDGDGIAATVRFRLIGDNPGLISIHRPMAADDRGMFNVLPADEFALHALPQYTSLLMSYPNPSNPEAWIPYELAEASDVRIEIHNSVGKFIRMLDLGYKQSGSHTSRENAAYWNGRNEIGETVASGVYFYTIRVDGFSATRKMTVVR